MKLFSRKARQAALEPEDYTPEEDTVLEVRNLTIEYVVDKVVSKAVSNVSFRVKRGQTVGIVGETGAGKTTTALACMNQVPDPPGIIREGHIYVCGEDILLKSKRQLEQIRGRDIAMIFQDPMTSLNPLLTVGEQIAESIRLHEHLGNREAFEKAQDTLEIVGIPRGRANDYPHQFSGGMKQRVMIAVALSCNPHVLLCDEPTTALDVTIQAQVLELMKKLREQYHSGMVMITHDLGIVANTCDEVLVMYAGRIIERGTARDIFDNTRHPYTEGLFNSRPNVRDRTAKLEPIPGLMPDPTRLPEGCAFAERCKYATDACRKAVPAEQKISETHTVSCTRYEESDFMIERGKSHA